MIKRNSGMPRNEHETDGWEAQNATSVLCRTPIGRLCLSFSANNLWVARLKINIGLFFICVAAWSPFSKCQHGWNYCSSASKLDVVGLVWNVNGLLMSSTIVLPSRTNKYWMFDVYILFNIVPVNASKVNSVYIKCTSSFCWTRHPKTMAIYRAWAA